jgi:uncharacterized protein
MVTDTFCKMARGGIYDQIGGGFHRYSVDSVWLVPHFEKMLYDHALLVRLGANLWQATHDNEVRHVTEETVKWVEREMTSPEGGFYSSLDADSDGEEGRFYVWTSQELDSILGKTSQIIREYYGVTPGGNFEGRNIPHVRIDPSLAAARVGVDRDRLTRIIADAKSKLYAVRAKRPWPARDEKILASWNGLMLRGLATAARAFENPEFTKLAERNGEFLFKEMVHKSRVTRSWRKGRAGTSGFLEDYAAVALGFLSLYELTFDTKWVTRANDIANSMITWFWDEQLDAFFDTPSDAEALITRPRDATDNATPSGTSMAVELMLSLSELLHDPEMRRRAEFVLETVATPMIRYPYGFGHMLGAADLSINGAVEVAIAGVPAEKSFQALRHEVSKQFIPSLILAGGASDNGIALMEGRSTTKGKATAYVCRSYSCGEPATTPQMLSSQLQTAGRIAD